MWPRREADLDRRKDAQEWRRTATSGVFRWLLARTARVPLTVIALWDKHCRGKHPSHC